MKLHFLSFIFLFSSMFVSFCQSYMIEYDLKNDESYRTDFIVASSMKQMVMGIEQSIDMNMEMSFNHRVVGKNENNNFNILTQYRRMYLKIAYAFDIIEIDTDRHDSTDNMSIMIKELMQKPFSIGLAKSGEIKEIRGFDKHIIEVLSDQRINEELTYSLPDELKNIMGEGAIKQNFTYFFGMYPSVPVKRNESWAIRYDVDQTGMKLHFNGEGTLVEVTPKTYLIRMNGTISTPDGENKLNSQKFSLSGKQMSEILIDRKNGWPLKSTVNQDISGMLLINELPGETESIEVPMQIKMRVTMSSSQ